MSSTTPFLRRNSPSSGGGLRIAGILFARRTLRSCYIELFLIVIGTIALISFFLLNNICLDESCRLPIFNSIDTKEVTPSRLISSVADSKLNELDTDYYQTKFDIDQVLLRYLGFDFDTYEKNHRSTHKSMVNFYQTHLKQTPKFNISGRDVAVFLHIQKTGGSAFGRHLIRDLRLPRPCQCDVRKRKKCPCLRPPKESKEFWLFSRYSIGWRCGLHADYTVKIVLSCFIRFNYLFSL